MSLHIFGAVLTHHGTAANNRAETDGNITTLQKLLWKGRVHTSVSAEAIRFALRRRLAESEETNRYWDETSRVNEWRDHTFSRYAEGKPFIDDDLLGFMSAEAAKEDASDTGETEGTGKGKAKKKGTANIRRAVLEVTRAVSLIPFGGDVTFNAASPGATPSAAKVAKSPVPYGTEVHATRYQYGFALTPGALVTPSRAAVAIRALCALGEVAGNHGRFLYDFSPESIVLRVTHDPAPRILYVFQETKSGIDVDELVHRVESGDVPGEELILGGLLTRLPAAERLKQLGAILEPGVRKAAEIVCERMAKGD